MEEGKGRSCFAMQKKLQNKEKGSTTARVYLKFEQQAVFEFKSWNHTVTNTDSLHFTDIYTQTTLLETNRVKGHAPVFTLCH